ncbi:MAG: DNA primase [Candidatus Sumerlaeia bacterium]
MQPANPIEFAQQLKDLVRIDQVVGEYVHDLARAGTGFKACCPFHNEKTPSFHVHPERGFYHCFGCGATGDVIKFVQEIEKVDFMMALELIARRAGVTMPAFSSTGTRTEEHDKQLEDLRRLCAWAEEYFIEQLHEHPRGKLGRQYFHKRGLSDDEIRKYRLGYAPDGFETLITAAGKRGWSPELVVLAGLASRRDNGSFVDRFRDRVMFPIADRMGQVVAFGGRIIEPKEDAPKYINSAETPLFHKSSLLYGVFAAREAIKTEGRVILLEGYMDWMSLHRRGICNGLAGMGTALTEEQVRLIHRLASKVTLLYDADAAGQKAAFRGTEMLLRQGIEVSTVLLPEGEDPDSFLESQGTAAMRERLAQATPAIDHFTELIAKSVNLSRPEGQADAVGRLAPIILAIQDPALRDGYIARTAGRLGLRADTVAQALVRRRPRPLSRPSEPEIEEPQAPASETASRSEQNLLYLLMNAKEPWDWLGQINPEWFGSQELRALYDTFYRAWMDVREGAEPPIDPFALCADEAQRQWLSRILCLPMRHFGGEIGRSADQAAQTAEALQYQLHRLQKEWSRRQDRQLREDLQIVLSQNPVGQGQLASIDKLHKEAIERHETFLGRLGQNKG